MEEKPKLAARLQVEADGRTAPNWSSYKVALEGSLSGKEIKGLDLDEVLLNQGDGKEPEDPGPDETVWRDAAPTGTTRTGSDYKAAVKKFATWAKANRVTHWNIMQSLPDELQEDCAQRLKAHELWRYLEDRFSGQSLTSTAALWVRLFDHRLDDYGGVAAYLTAITKTQLELERAGQDVNETLLAGVVMRGMGDRYPLTRELLLAAPLAEQTKSNFGQRLMEAEKNAAATADMAALTLGGKGVPKSPAGANQKEARYSPCKYVRKHQGKYPNQAPGTPCGRRHSKTVNCWAKMDDAWLIANPGKTGSDLPNWREVAGRQTGGPGAATANVVSTSSTVPSAPSVLSSESFEEGSFLGYLCAQAGTAPRGDDQSPVEVGMTVALDSGATASCFRQGEQFRPLAEPVTVRGALPGQVSLAKGTTCIPCPALPSGQLRGLHSPEFRHNLISVSELQQQGLDVFFPAGTRKALCRDPKTGAVLWAFRQGQLGLYEAKVREGSLQKGKGNSVTAATAQVGQAQLHPTELLHRRLGHLGETSIKTLIRYKAIEGLPAVYTPPPAPFQTVCVPCIQGKLQASPHPLLRRRASRPLERVHVDLVGPLPKSVKGHRYWLTIVDDHSRYGWTILLHTKDQAKHKLIEWHAWAERQSGHQLGEFHSDRGSEFVNDMLMGHYRSQGVQCTFSNPDSPEQNGIAEARNKQVGIFTRTLLIQSGAPVSYWNYASQHATLLNNLVPHRLLGGTTPYQAWHHSVPSLHRLRVWGCTGHVLMNKEERRKRGGKLGPVTKTCMLIGVNPSGPGWLLYDPVSRREVPSSDVSFQEHAPYFQHKSQGPAPPLQWDQFPTDTSQPDFNPDDTADTEQEESTGAELPGTPSQEMQNHDSELIARGHDPYEGGQIGSQAEPVGMLGQETSSSHVDHMSTESVEGVASRAMMGSSNLPDLVLGLPAQGSQQVHSTEGQAEQAPLRRSLRLQGLPPAGGAVSLSLTTGISQPCIPPSATVLLQEVVKGESGDKHREIPTPATWQEALHGEHSAEWLESMIRESTGLDAAGTFETVPREQAKNILRCKWVYKVKRRPDGAPHYKSRLVVKGCSQKHGIDYFETYAPTAKQVTGRLVLHLAATLGYHVRAMDVDQAFCHGDLTEEIYMEPPPVGLSEPVPAGAVWKLKRPLYGLKQAPRQWHAKLRTVLQTMGFTPVPGEPSLFIHQDETGSWLLVYVDDLLLLSKSTARLDAFKEQLLHHFPMKDLGDVTQYLGMEVSRDWEKQEIYLSQQRYIGELVKKFGQEEGREYATPLAVNHQLRQAQEGDETHPDQHRFPELLGGIMYLMVCTRPDVAHAVSVLARYVGEGRHSAMHWKAALRLLGYLKATARHRLVLGGPTATLVGHSDSSWADVPTDRRSSQGYCFSLGAGVVSWKATRSPAVALSTCEAELYAICSAAQECMWLIGLLATLGHAPKTPPYLWCDNESTVSLTKDAMFSGRSKHIEARYYFVRELVQAQRLKTAHVSGVDNVADIFTKPLLADNHARLTAMLGLSSSPSA